MTLQILVHTKGMQVLSQVKNVKYLQKYDTICAKH